MIQFAKLDVFYLSFLIYFINFEVTGLATPKSETENAGCRFPKKVRKTTEESCEKLIVKKAKAKANANHTWLALKLTYIHIHTYAYLLKSTNRPWWLLANWLEFCEFQELGQKTDGSS